MHRRHLRKRFAALGIAAVASVTIAACGGGSPSSTTSTTTSSANAAAASGATGATGRGALVACLRRNGAALPSRPFGGRRPFDATGASGASGRFGPGGVFGGARGGTGATGRRGFFGGGLAGNSTLAKAFEKCRGLGGGFGGRRFGTGATGFTLSAADRAELTRFVACMNTNGDSLPTPNLTSGGSIFTGVNTKSSAFTKAYAACGTIITFIRRPPAAPPAA